MIGKTISKYTINTLLGKNNIGEVYTASSDQMQVIIRRINLQSISANIEIKLQLKNDLYSLSQLSVPGMEGVLEYVETGSDLFIISEFVQGRSLLSFLSGKVHTNAAVFQHPVVVAIFETLQAVHNKGLFHGHLRPANIIVTAEEKLKILNFGISGLSELGSETPNRGIIEYLSPEQIQKRNIDKRTDIYSIGVLLFELITAVKPYADLENEKDVYEKKVSEPFSNVILDNATIPEPFASIIAKATAMDPENRYQKIEQFRAALSSGEPPKVGTSSIKEPLPIQNFIPPVQKIVPPVQQPPAPAQVPVTPIPPPVKQVEQPVVTPTVKPNVVNPYKAPLYTNKPLYTPTRKSSGGKFGFVIGIIAFAIGIGSAIFHSSEKKDDSKNDFSENINYDSAINQLTNSAPYNSDSLVKSLLSDSARLADSVYVNADELPVFPGGDAGMNSWIKERVKYPKPAKDNGIQGTVEISFIIEKDGHVTDVRIVKDIGGSCGMDAKHLIAQMPGWKPAKISGKPVRMKKNVSVKYAPK
jgi:serine/threonine-protein kinase